MSGFKYPTLRLCKQPPCPKPVFIHDLDNSTIGRGLTKNTQAATYINTKQFRHGGLVQFRYQVLNKYNLTPVNVYKSWAGAPYGSRQAPKNYF